VSSHLSFNFGCGWVSNLSPHMCPETWSPDRNEPVLDGLMWVMWHHLDCRQRNWLFLVLAVFNCWRLLGIIDNGKTRYVSLPVPTDRHSPRQNDFQHRYGRTAWFYLYQQACESDTSAGAVAPIRNGTPPQACRPCLCLRQFLKNLPSRTWCIPISSEHICAARTGKGLWLLYKLLFF
jgi:hypothetical protein